MTLCSWVSGPILNAIKAMVGPNCGIDISMPVMDGMEATREIRKLERERRQKPALIIALTGLGSASSQQEAFSNGINIFLTKPVRFDDLRKIMSDWTPDIVPHSLGN